MEDKLVYSEQLVLVNGDLFTAGSSLFDLEIRTKSNIKVKIEVYKIDDSSLAL